MRNPVESVPEPHRKVDKRKLDFLFATQLHVVSFTSLFAGASPTGNSPTMANDSLLDLQEQWQWDHCVRLVVISALRQQAAALEYSIFNTSLHPNKIRSAMAISTSSTSHTTMTMMALQQSNLHVLSQQFEWEHPAGGSPSGYDH
jgi:hypothetical protein